MEYTTKILCNLWDIFFVGIDYHLYGVTISNMVFTVNEKLSHTWDSDLAWEINAWITKFPQGCDDISNNEFLKTFANNSLYKVSGDTSKMTCKNWH